MPQIMMLSIVLLLLLHLHLRPPPLAAAFHSPVPVVTVTTNHALHWIWRRRQQQHTSPMTATAGLLITAPSPPSSSYSTRTKLSTTRLHSSINANNNNNNRPTELPDSLVDAAATAAEACHRLLLSSSSTTSESHPIRCRVDFDTSVGDETYTPLKRSSEFMLAFVNALCLASVEGVREWKQERASSRVVLLEAERELMNNSKEKEQAEERRMMMAGLDGRDDDDDGENGDDAILIDGNAEEVVVAGRKNDQQQPPQPQQQSELLQIISSEGKQLSNSDWNGKHTVRIYFPDEGSAALARRDWTSILPPCVVYDACGGVASRNIKEKRSDVISIFYCPRASESEYVEKLLLEAEESSFDGGGTAREHEEDEVDVGAHKMTIMVNPLLVDMGVTGFGMAGRRLRERLIDGLIPAYYLRTLPWGALTRCYPNLFTVWMEDENEEGGYRMIQAMDRLPSNPEVEDIYDIATGNTNAPKEGMGFLNALGDFVNGMTRL